MKVSKLSKHAEWLSLIEISGPFLTVSMLDEAFPQGLEAVETPKRQKLRAAYEEWCEALDQEDKLLPELHREWVRLVLTEMLEYDQESLVHAGDWPDELPIVSSQEHTGTQVRIAAYGPGAERFLGVIDQTEIFTAMLSALRLQR